MGALLGCPCLLSALLPVRVKAAVRGSLFVRERGRKQEEGEEEKKRKRRKRKEKKKKNMKKFPNMEIFQKIKDNL
jgi:hypothetical protein